MNSNQADVAKRFRIARRPSDALIFLGTTRIGWNNQRKIIDFFLHNQQFQQAAHSTKSQCGAPPGTIANHEDDKPAGR